MTAVNASISLGFAKNPVERGTHICLIFSSDEERRDSLLKFLLSGLRNDEKTTCFSSNITEEEIRLFFDENNISYDERKKKGQVNLSGTGEVYFEDGVFIPERMLKNLKNFYTSSQTEGYENCRVIGEMISEINKVAGGERLMEYECRVTKLVDEYPITTVCQYDAREFSGSMILEVLKVHPRIFVNGAIVNNPYFIQPDDYLRDHSRHG